jgi:hypothetical protein
MVTVLVTVKDSVPMDVVQNQLVRARMILAQHIAVLNV